MERRETYLLRERMAVIAMKLAGQNFECFHLRSQSEGTTTPGLQSDIEFLCSKNRANIMRFLGDWKAGIENFLMFHDDITPPQQYLLQVIKMDTPEPKSSLCDDAYVRKNYMQVLLSSERFKQKLEHEGKDTGKVSRNGPSVSFTTNWDIVYAFHVLKPLPEIQHWIDRCRGRHWPPVQLLKAAQVAPCFLVPAGHQDSDYKREEWRLSPNLIERMLMFSFNMTQIKCYVVLKYICKALFYNIVGDSITSFHCKTIMFNTIEKTHPSLWLDHHLMFCIWLCLHVLRKWLRLGRLSHYIIDGVNLFDGKLSNVQQRRLLVYIDGMLGNNLQNVFFIDIDKLGFRLHACSLRRIGQSEELEHVCLRKEISLLLKFECLAQFLKWKLCILSTTFKQSIHYKLRNLSEGSTNIILQPVALEFVKHLYVLQNSMQLSYSLQVRNVICSEIISRFKYSFNTDVASSRLKLAYVLYCSGHFHAAVKVFEDVERRYHSKVKAVCGCRKKQGEGDLEVFANMQSGSIYKGSIEPPFAFCVRFLREEAYCVPSILLFEMNRNITEEEVAQRGYAEKQWMDSAEVDALPFLHYLQYITYGSLAERDKQLHSLGLLVSYIYDVRTRINLYHTETALNLLGHCYEMERDYESALFYYELSLLQYDTNNAANWHVRRILRRMFG